MYAIFVVKVSDKPTPIKQLVSPILGHGYKLLDWLWLWLVTNLFDKNRFVTSFVGTSRTKRH